MTQKPEAELFRLMAARVVDYAIFLLDVEGNVISWNAGAEAIKQYTESDIIGKHFSIFYTPADKARDWPNQELRRAMTEGRFEDDGWRVRKDGSRFWANVIITALRDERGTLRAFSKITRDLTARKNYDEIMRQSEERFRLLVEGVQDYAIYMVDPSGVVSSWNLGAHRIKGYAATEIIGRHCSRFYTPEDIKAGKPWSELAIAREHGRIEDEGWRVRKDGSRFWARLVVTPLYNSEGVLRGFAKVTQDLTQRRHAEALEMSANNVNDFIAVLAHELRNPLAPIRNAIQLQRMAGAGESAHKAAIDIIERQSSQLARIVDDLLDVSRISRGTLSINKQPVGVATIVERAIETAKPNIEAARHKLEALIPPGDLDVSGDELRLTQALTNIINNAARYTDPGGNIYIKVSVVEDEGLRQVCISVRDTGRGIEPNLLHSIFGMFVQGRESLNRPSAGLGVGLALARSIVELHHGTLEARSAGTGKGAEFIICLPALPPTAAAAAETKMQTAGMTIVPPEAVTLPTSRVLLVDDNVDAAFALSSLLKNHGQEVLTVSTGVEALEAFEGFRPEIVLLDIGMPGMDGLEIARRLRERNRSPRPLIVAVTGWNKPEDMLKSKDAGFDLHFVKPLEEPQLLEILHSRRKSTA